MRFKSIDGNYVKHHEFTFNGKIIRIILEFRIR